MDPLGYELFRTVAENASEGIIITDQNNHVLYINNACKRLLNVQKLDDVNLFMTNRTEMKWGEKTFSLRVEEANINKMRIKVCYVSEITEQLRLEDELLCLRTIIDNINDGVTACDKNGYVCVYNKQIAKIEGNSPNEILGKHYFDVWELPPEKSYFLGVYETGMPRVDEGWNRVTKTGNEINYVHSTYPIKKQNEVIGVFCLTRNFSRIRQLLTRTIELQEKLVPNKDSLSNGTRFTFKDIIGESESIKTTISRAVKASQTLAPVMVCGETGTGKELFVQSIHNAGPNSDQPFVAVNCAAIPETLLESVLFGTTKGAFTGAESSKGLFEQAGKGTLYLDEINSMPLTLQAKILRVLQEKKVRRIGGTTEILVQCRIISATNEDHLQCVNNGRLRRDLYYRLAGICITVPPLRERENDVELLAKYFLKQYARLYGIGSIKIAPDLLQLLNQHHWNGNVRELEHVLESSIAMMEDEDVLSVHHFPPHLRSQFSSNAELVLLSEPSQKLVPNLQKLERTTIVEVLETNNWNITQAAKALGIRRQNLQYRIRKLQIVKPN